MPARRFFSLWATLFITAFLVTGCGGGNKAPKQNTGATAAASPVASPAAAPAKAGATTAPVPAKLNCGAVQPVWANMRTHVYHTASDPLYGRTRHGQYMCPQQAASAGYHAAGAGSAGMHHGRKGHHGSATPGAMAQPSPSP